MKISIALAVYNGSTYIKEQLDSIASQTVLPDQIVISDDCSKDDTVRICERFKADTTLNIEILRNAENVGYSQNFERAISICTGDIIFFCDQDDVWKKIKIEEMLSVFENDGAIGLVYCNAIITNGSLEPLGYTVFETSGKSEVFKGDDRNAMDMLKNPKIKGCTMAIKSAYLSLVLPIRKTGRNAYWGYDYQIALLYYSFTKIHAIKEPLMYYRIHEANTSKKKELIKEKRKEIRWEKEFRYSSDILLKSIVKYRTGIEVIKNVKKSRLHYDVQKTKRMEQFFIRELKILSDREKIWREKFVIKRILKIGRYLVNGYYFRYYRWVGPFLKDFFGSYNKLLKEHF